MFTNRYNGQYIGNANPSNSGQIWLDNVQCRGNETDFTQCTHAGWGSHNCNHSQDVSIACFSDSSRQHAGHILDCLLIRRLLGGPMFYRAFYLYNLRLKVIQIERSVKDGFNLPAPSEAPQQTYNGSYWLNVYNSLRYFAHPTLIFKG